MLELFNGLIIKVRGWGGEDLLEQKHFEISKWGWACCAAASCGKVSFKGAKVTESF